MADLRRKITMSEALELARGNWPWPKGSKFSGKIEAQQDIERDGLPIALVIVRTGMMGDSQLYTVGAAFVDGENVVEKFDRKASTAMTYEQAEKALDRLATDDDRLMMVLSW